MTRRARKPTLIADQAITPMHASEVRALFDRMIDEEKHRLRPAGTAKKSLGVLRKRYRPDYLVEFAGHRYFLTRVRHDKQFRFFVAYVLPKDGTDQAQKNTLYPRIFYKDSSLVWRVATHYINTPTEHWIGKGDVKAVKEDGKTVWYSAEETTDLPFEIQTALDAASRDVKKPRADRQALTLILRDAPDDRVKPYSDFSSPRRRAMQDPKQSINGNKAIAWFKDPADPTSLRFARGYAPDFKNGLITASASRSKLYGGRILRFRIASQNRKVQYLFMHGPHQQWLIPPQSVRPEITRYGVRPVDALTPDDLCIPGYEYHYYEDDENEQSELVSQIPAGFVGDASSIDPMRSDASPWNNQMPVMKKFLAHYVQLRIQAKI